MTRPTKSNEVFRLEGLQVACGTMGMPTATVRLRGLDGQNSHARRRWARVRWMPPIRPSTQIVGLPNTLLEFNVHSVTEGIDAMGEVTVRLQAAAMATPAAHHAAERAGTPAHLWWLRRRYRYHRCQRQSLSIGFEQDVVRQRAIYHHRRGEQNLTRPEAGENLR